MKGAVIFQNAFRQALTPCPSPKGRGETLQKKGGSVASDPPSKELQRATAAKNLVKRITIESSMEKVSQLALERCC